MFFLKFGRVTRFSHFKKKTPIFIYIRHPHPPFLVEEAIYGVCKNTTSSLAMLPMKWSANKWDVNSNEVLKMKDFFLSFCKRYSLSIMFYSKFIHTFVVKKLFVLLLITKLYQLFPCHYFCLQHVIKILFQQPILFSFGASNFATQI